jgi:hypothetical protein
MKKYLFTLLCKLLCLSQLAQAQLELPAIFSDNMVLQQKMAIPVWGKSCRGCEVNVSFDGFSLKTKTDKNGHWKANMPAHTAGSFSITGYFSKAATSFSKYSSGRSVALCWAVQHGISFGTNQKC